MESAVSLSLALYLVASLPPPTEAVWSQKPAWLRSMPGRALDVLLPRYASPILTGFLKNEIVVYCDGCVCAFVCVRLSVCAFVCVHVSVSVYACICSKYFPFYKETLVVLVSTATITTTEKPRQLSLSLAYCQVRFIHFQ